MRKRFSFLMACLVALATLTPATAQRLAPQGQTLAEKRLSGQRSQVTNSDMAKKDLPLFLQGKRIMSETSTILKKPLRSGSIFRKTVPSPVLGAPSTYVPTIYGNFQNQTFGGFQAFSPQNATPEELLTYTTAYFNSGSGIVDGKMCGVYFMNYGFGYAIMYFSVDMDTWQIAEAPVQIEDISLIANETATDPTDGTIFGQFFTADGKSVEFGVVDYANKTRTTIGPSTKSYVALGIAKDGFAYGVASDGNLYKIDRTTGTETLVGSTGVELLNSEGQVYYQSGEIDPKTNVFYWCASDKNSNNALYTVDLTTGTANKLYDMAPGSMYSIAIPAPSAADDAPAAVEDLTAIFNDASLEGQISFKAPTKTFDNQNNLTGELKWHIYVNGTETLNGKVVPGGEVTQTLTTAEGLQKIEVCVENDKGNGPKSKVMKYVGYDQPEAPTKVKLTVDENLKATITWTAPAAGIHNGYLGTLKYNVYRISGKDTTQIGTDIATTTLTDNLPQTSLKNYKYGVVAINNTQHSAMALSNNEIVGEALDPPFFDDFETDMSLYTVIDVNGDGSTWVYSSAVQAAQYKYSSKNDADDWLITPGINLKAGKTYNVSFRARANGTKFHERIEAKWGKAATVAGMSNNLTDGVKELVNKTFQKFEKQIKPTEDGKYYFGFHAVSEKDKFYLYVDSISVELEAEQTAPAAVTDLKATADATGALKATIEFKAPAKNIKGDALTSISKIEVKRGNTLVKTINNPAPGSKQTFVDEAAQRGDNKYTVIAFNNSGAGLKAEVTVYVGVDVPNAPKAKAKDKITSVELSWEAVKGKNNGLICPNKVRYDIFNVSDGSLGDSISSVTGGLQYTITGVKTDEGNQEYMHWAMRAVNEAGASGWSVAAAIGGAPYKLPYHNSFKNATLEDKFVGLETSNSAQNANISKDEAYDNDGGSMYFTSTAAGKCSVVFGKFNLAGTSAAKMMFVYKASASPAKMTATAERFDGTMVKIWEKDLANADGTWQQVMADIPASLAADKYVIIRLTTETTGAVAGKIFVDNVNILEPIQKDAAIELTAPENVIKGQTITMTAKVTNQGIEDLNDAKVIVTINGKKIGEKTVTNGLKSMAEEKIDFTYKTSSTDAKETLEVQAEVKVAGDLKADNNIAKASIAATMSTVAPPTDLKATKNANGSADLSWKAPAASETVVNDDFESYDAWSLTMGEWTTHDADQGETGGIVNGAKYPHQGEKWAFINWQPADYLKAGQGLDPHSGNRAAVAIYQISGGNFIDSDNWLISPRLSGKAQTVSFWVNNAIGQGYGTETFEVLISSKTNDIANFTKVGDTYTQGNGVWTQISVEVPEGTTYFAIHQNTNKDEALIFMIDDASYTANSAPIAYNVYRNGVLIGTVEEVTYNDATPGTEAEYQVTAVYPNDIESTPVKASLVSGVSIIEAAGAQNFNVYTIDGRQLLNNAKNLNSLAPGIYIVNGKKVAILK